MSLWNEFRHRDQYQSSATWHVPWWWAFASHPLYQYKSLGERSSLLKSSSSPGSTRKGKKKRTSERFDEATGRDRTHVPQPEIKVDSACADPQDIILNHVDVTKGKRSARARFGLPIRRPENITRCHVKEDSTSPAVNSGEKKAQRCKGCGSCYVYPATWQASLAANALSFEQNNFGTDLECPVAEHPMSSNRPHDFRQSTQSFCPQQSSMKGPSRIAAAIDNTLHCKREHAAWYQAEHPSCYGTTRSDQPRVTLSPLYVDLRCTESCAHRSDSVDQAPSPMTDSTFSMSSYHTCFETPSSPVREVTGHGHTERLSAFSPQVGLHPDGCVPYDSCANHIKHRNAGYCTNNCNGGTARMLHAISLDSVSTDHSSRDNFECRQDDSEEKKQRILDFICPKSPPLPPTCEPHDIYNEKFSLLCCHGGARPDHVC